MVLCIAAYVTAGGHPVMFAYVPVMHMLMWRRTTLSACPVCLHLSSPSMLSMCMSTESDKMTPGILRLVSTVTMHNLGFLPSRCHGNIEASISFVGQYREKLPLTSLSKIQEV